MQQPVSSPRSPPPNFGQYVPYHEHMHCHEHQPHTFVAEQQLNNVSSIYPRIVYKRAAGLKALCVCELLFALWSMLLGANIWVFLIYIAIDIVGFYGSHNLRKQVLTVFTVLKAMLLGLLMLFFTDYITQWVSCDGCQYERGELPMVAVISVLILAFQILCLYLAIKIRQDIIQVERSAFPTVELHSISESQLQQVQQIQPQVDYSNYPQEAVPQAPAYPYPQFYPMPYMNQGYPMPYATPYPQMVPGNPPTVPTYPAYAISEEVDTTPHQHNDTQRLL